jgi:predicted nucleic acid-binding protein
LTSPIFVDSGAFIAFLDRSDSLHADVAGLFSAPPKRWLTSLPVVAESHGWFLNRLGEEAARRFLSLLQQLPNIGLLGVDGAHHAAVLRKLDVLHGSKLTYVDASSLVFIAQRRVRTVWGCDQHLAIEGATVVPGARGAA